MNDLPKIEKNIPLRDGGLKGQTKIDFLKSMEVGDSFEVDIKERGSWQRFIYNDLHNYEFKLRKQPENKMRIWRTK